MENKKNLLLLLTIPVLFACGETASSVQTTTSNGATSVTSTTSSSQVDPLTELYDRIDACVTNKNYTLKYNINDTVVERLYLPNAFYNLSKGEGYAEDSTGIFSYSLFKTNVIASQDYLRDSETSEALKDLYNIKVTTETSERIYTDYLVNSLNNVNYSKVSTLKLDETTGLYRISSSYVKGIIPNDPDTDMYNSSDLVTTRIGLTDNGFEIHFYNKYAMEIPLILECYDIGTTKIDPITTYLNENKGPGDSGTLEDYSQLAKIKKLFDESNYTITVSNGEKRYLNDKYVVTEKDLDNEKYRYGYVVIPEENNLDLDTGIYAYEINDDAVTLTETEPSITSLRQAGASVSTSIFSQFTENDDGTITSPSGYNLYSYSDSFSSSISEEGAYVKECSIELTIENDAPVVTFNCKIFNDNTNSSYDLSVVVSDFGTTSHAIMEDYLNSII